MWHQQKSCPVSVPKKSAQGFLTWCRVHCPSLVGSFVGIGEDRPTEHWSRTLSAWCGSKTFGWGRGRCWGGWGIGSNQDKLRVWWELWGFASNLVATSWITSLHPSWNMRSFTFYDIKCNDCKDITYRWCLPPVTRIVVAGRSSQLADPFRDAKVSGRRSSSCQAKSGACA